MNAKIVNIIRQMAQLTTSLSSMFFVIRNKNGNLYTGGVDDYQKEKLIRLAKELRQYSEDILELYGEKIEAKPNEEEE